MVLVVIPARWGSTRLPQKPLVEIAGRPMIEHVYRQAKLAGSVAHIVVATDHEEIAAVVRGFGGEAAMTGECSSGTDRVAQVAREMTNFDIIVNVQGDWLIPPEMIEETVTPLRDDPNLGMASLKRFFREGEDPENPNMVKVVTDTEDNALYFSRSILPYPRNPGGPGPFLHMGIYAFRRETLFEFTGLPQTPLEKAEGLEQLRALENGIRIRVPTTSHFSTGVDTAEDLERIRKTIDENGNLNN